MNQVLQKNYTCWEKLRENLVRDYVLYNKKELPIQEFPIFEIANELKLKFSSN